MNIGIIGCGNLGNAILQGVASKFTDAKIVASRRDVSKIVQPEQGNVTVTNDNRQLLATCDILIFTLKPYTILPFIQEHRDALDANRHTIISAATGVHLDELSEAVGKDIGVYRAMPNTATAVNESLTAIASGKDPLHRQQDVHDIFNALGSTVHIEESLMDAATILGACGVAYVLRFMRAMIQGGIEVGFDAQTATKIVSQTMKGAAELIQHNGTHPEEEIDKVTTPKGCTIVGLNEMEHAGFSSALIKGIVTSYNKIND
jgi:pyrroline-5-carboxylate reductase